MKRIIIAVLALAVILSFLFWKFSPSSNSNLPGSTGVELTYWGLWEDDNTIRSLISQYQQQNPNVTVNYTKQSSINYRTRLQTQIREGVGPDIFMIHNSWLPMLLDDLAPAPQDIFSLSEYQNTFYPIAQDSFVKNGTIYGVSTKIDGLGLYYNEDILSGVGGQVPKNWQEFIDLAIKTTVKDQNGIIQTAGAGLGTTSNVDYWSDILGLLLLQQPKVDLSSSIATPEVAEVLKFYTGFVTDPNRKAWDVNLPNTTQAFEQGKLTFYFAPYEKLAEIKQANPNLKFKIAPVPQLSGRMVGWGSFWGQAVSARSKNQTAAWKFIKFLTSKEAEKQLGASGPYSRVDLASEVSADPLLGSFVNQGPFYKFWYLESNTFDRGINEEMIKYFEDGINATLAGTAPEAALQTVDQGAKQVLQKYTDAVPLPTK